MGWSAPRGTASSRVLALAPGYDSPMQASRHRTASAVALALGPALLGVATAVGGLQSAATTALLWGEPMLLAAALYGVLYLSWERRSAEALSLLFGSILGAVAIHQPATPLPVDGLDAAWSERLRDCASQPERPTGEVRTLIWTLRGSGLSPADLTLIEGQRPDLVVLTGGGLAEPAQALSQALGGESKLLPGPSPDADLALVVRGGFHYCGGREDVWEMPLPRHPGGQARAVLSFPDVRGVGVVPLLVGQLDDPGAMGEWLRWPARVLGGGRQLGALAHALGPNNMVVVADAQAPRTARQLDGLLMGAGLDPLSVPATWPDRLGPIPALPQHALDRAWVGSGWANLGVTTIRGSGHDRRGLLLRIRPR